MKTLNIIFFGFLLLYCKNSVAHGAHEHGIASLGIALENNNIVSIIFEASGQDIYGFEYIPLSDLEKESVAKITNILKNNISQMIIFKNNYECKNTLSTITPFVKEEESHEHNKNAKSHEHFSLRGNFEFKCKLSPIGSKVTFSFSKFFKSIQKIKIQYTSEKKQQGITLEKDKGEIEL